MSASPLLKVAGIDTYYGPIQAIRGVTLEVPEGRLRLCVDGLRRRWTTSRVGLRRKCSQLRCP